jgi:hypothetical protein
LGSLGLRGGLRGGVRLGLRLRVRLNLGDMGLHLSNVLGLGLRHLLSLRLRGMLGLRLSRLDRLSVGGFGLGLGVEAGAGRVRRLLGRLVVGDRHPPWARLGGGLGRVDRKHRGLEGGSHLARVGCAGGLRLLRLGCACRLLGERRLRGARHGGWS